MNSVLLEKDPPLGWLTLNRPETRNALSLEMIGSVRAPLTRLRKIARYPFS